MTEWGRSSHVWWKRQLSFPSTGNLFKQTSGQLQKSSLPATWQLLAWTGCSRLLDLCESKYCLLPLHISLRSAKFVSSLFRLHSPILNIPACSSKSKSHCDKQTTRNRVLLTNSFSVNYEIPQILWDPIVHYRLNNSLQFFLIKEVYALPSCVSRFISTLYLCICKGLQVDSLLRGFPLKPSTYFFSPSADHSNGMWWLQRLKFACLLLQICKNVCVSYTSFISI
jgi:hypothetical protein